MEYILITITIIVLISYFFYKKDKLNKFKELKQIQEFREKHTYDFNQIRLDNFNSSLEYLSENKHKIKNDSSEPPESFGYKCLWIAVKTNQQQRIADIIELQNRQSSSWSSGIDWAYKNYSFVYLSPTINKWSFIVGWGIPSSSEEKSLEKLKTILGKLSSEFEEAQYFGSYRVTGYAAWIKYKNGELKRMYSSSDGRIIEFGTPTNVEEKYNLINDEEAKKDENYYDRDDLDYADEEIVLEVAESWSINPIDIEERTDTKGLGIIGILK